MPPEAAPFEHTVYPDGAVNLVVMQRRGLRHATLQGPHDEPLRVQADPGDRFWGVRCWPDAGGALFGVEPAALHNRMRLATDVCPDVDALVDALLRREAADVWTALLGARVADSAPLDLVVRRTVLLLIAEHGRVTLDDVPRPWAMLAAEYGCADQAHLVREFRALAGMTPREATAHAAPRVTCAPCHRQRARLFVRVLHARRLGRSGVEP